MRDQQGDYGEDEPYGAAPAVLAFHDISPMSDPVSVVRRNDGPRVARKSDLGDAWPEVRTWLLGRLRRRLDQATAEDVCQEVALLAVKAMDKGRAFESVGELARWSNVAATHRVIDLWRQGRRDPVGLPVGSGEAMDAARVVEGRFILAEVAAALDQLPSEQREALLDDEPLPRNDPASFRRRVRRNRARRYLKAVVHSWPGLAPLRRFPWLRRFSDRLAGHPLAVAEWGQVVAGFCLSIAAAASHAIVDGPSSSATATATTPRTSVFAAASGVTSDVVSGAAPRDGSPGRARDLGASPASSASAPPSRTQLATVDGPVARGSAGLMDQPDDRPLACVAVERDQLVCLPSPVVPPLPGGIPAGPSQP